MLRTKMRLVEKEDGPLCGKDGKNYALQESLWEVTRFCNAQGESNDMEIIVDGWREVPVSA